MDETYIIEDVKEKLCFVLANIKRDLNVAWYIFPLVFDILLKRSKSLQFYEGLAIMNSEA